MKGKLLISCTLALSLLASCNKEEFTVIASVSIELVRDDNSVVDPGDCLTPFENYVIKVETIGRGKGKFKGTTIDFSHNGTIRSVTFTEIGNKYVPVSLQDGLNTFQLIETGEERSVYFAVQNDFEQVN